MKKKVIFLVLVSTCLLVNTARAQLFLEEGKVVLAVSPGERVNKSIMISNTTDKEVTVRVYWQDFEYKPPYDGAKAFLPEGTSVRSLNKMVNFSPNSFQLPGFGKQKVEYAINMPAQAQGGYYGVLFFEKAPDPKEAKIGVSIVTRVGSLFFVETKNKSKKSEINNILIQSDKITGVFHNQGDVILIPRMTYNVFDKEGLVADRGEVKKVYVPPGASANWEISFEKKLPAGRFSLALNTDLDDGDVIVTELNLDVNDAGHLKIENP